MKWFAVVVGDACFCNASTSSGDITGLFYIIGAPSLHLFLSPAPYFATNGKRQMWTTQQADVLLFVVLAGL